MSVSSIALPHLNCCGGGKSYSIGNCRSPNNHHGSALKARKEGNPVTPLLRQRHPISNRASGPTVQGNKGVLRTIGSKSTFAYFSLTRKVGRRRQNTIRNTVGQKRRKMPSAGGGIKRPAAGAHSHSGLFDSLTPQRCRYRQRPSAAGPCRWGWRWAPRRP